MAETRPLPVFITGASRGIGAATAREFARRGHPVALMARNKEALERLAGEIRGAGGTAIALARNVGDSEAVMRAIGATLTAFGALGIVINNAATVEPLASVAEADMRQWGHAMDVNLSGPIYVMHYAAPHLPAGGVVINVTSGAGEHALVGRSAYCASKAGLMIASRVFAAEEAARGIRVIAFSPGLVDTEMNALNRAHRMGNAGHIDVADLRPPEETARIIAFLTGPDAGGYHGQVINARDPDLRRAAGVAVLSD